MPCKSVRAHRVREAIFSVEGHLVETKEFESKVTPGKKTGVLAIVEGSRFWVREDAINEAQDYIDPAVRLQKEDSALTLTNLHRCYVQ